MACELASPIWPLPGVRTAIENLANDTIYLSWNPATSVAPATQIYYTVYYSLDANMLYDEPFFVTSNTSISIPKTIASIGHHFAVRATQLGISNDISSPNMFEAVPGGFSLPSPITLRVNLGVLDGYIGVDSTAGFPNNDGYVLVGDEVVLYSSTTPSYAGGHAFIIQERDPFNCNNVISHLADGYAQVSIFRGSEVLFDGRQKAHPACGMPRPTWVDSHNVGLQQVNDLGIGTAMTLSWSEAVAPKGFSSIFYNVYHGRNLFSLTSESPVGITSARSVIDPNLHPGDGYYYIVRPTYFLESFPITQLGQISENFYAYPKKTLVNEGDGYFQQLELGQLDVLSTIGYPNAGLLKIGSEILKYSSKSATSFNVTQRDVFEMGFDVSHANGASVLLFQGIEELNNVFYRGVPSWENSAIPPRLDLILGDGYYGFEFLQDPDGYRSQSRDNINEDHTTFEQNNDGTPPLSYCGLRRETFVDLYQGQRCGTFHGGSNAMKIIPGVNGGNPVRVGGGFDVFESALQREEFLLGLTGEPFILLRRKWTGHNCPRLSFRSEHPHARCGICFGTGFAGGYERFLNSRELRPGEPNPNGFLQIRITPYSDKLVLNQDRGLNVDEVVLEAWIPALPIIKVRDILVKFTFDIEFGALEEEFRYEVTNVIRNKLLFGKEGSQKLTLKRLNKTEEIYKLPKGGIILV